MSVFSRQAHVANVVHRDNTLWAVQTVFLPITNATYTGIQWWQIGTNGDVLGGGVLTNSSKSYAYPSIAVNRNQDILIGYSSFASTQYASAEYTFRAKNTSMFRLPYILQAGAGDYVLADDELRNRWGDYSAAMTDPVNDMDFWTIQEFAERPLIAGTNRIGRWGTWWGNIAVAVPGNDNFADAFQISGTDGTTNGSLFRATRETAAGEPDHGGAGGNRSIWFKWTAPATGDVSFDTFQSLAKIDTLLAVYTGVSVGSLTVITNNDNYRGPKSNLSFTAASGTTYYVAVDARDTSYENSDVIVLHWSQAQSPEFVLDPYPSPVNTLAGDSFTLYSKAIGVATLTYQWRTNDVNISGATSSSYTNPNPQPASTNSPTTYEYRVVVTNGYGSATSEIAYVTVYPSGSSTHTNAIYDLTNNYFAFHVFGVTTHVYAVQATIDYTNWVTLTNQTASFDFTNHLVTTNFPYRMFRTVY
jgi:hypothetical protein